MKSLIDICPSLRLPNIAEKPRSAVAPPEEPQYQLAGPDGENTSLTFETDGTPTRVDIGSVWAAELEAKNGGGSTETTFQDAAPGTFGTIKDAGDRRESTATEMSTVRAPTKAAASQDGK